MTTRSSAGTPRVDTLGRNKLRDAKLDWLKLAAREYEAKPYDEDAKTAVLGAARAWAKAEREARGPQTQRALEEDAAAAAALSPDVD